MEPDLVNTRPRKPGYAAGFNPVRDRHRCSTLVVRRAPRLGSHLVGHLRVHPAITLPCALGRSGVTRRKREGDGATPTGTMRILYGYYRPDRVGRPRCASPLRRLYPALGWCDEPGAALYNRPAPLPMRPTHEEMWRQDGLYDVVFALDYNMTTRRNRLGSAIFLHCAKADLKPTLGCVALRPADMRRLLPRLARNAAVTVL